MQITASGHGAVFFSWEQALPTFDWFNVASRLVATDKNQS